MRIYVNGVRVSVDSGLLDRQKFLDSDGKKQTDRLFPQIPGRD